MNNIQMNPTEALAANVVNTCFENIEHSIIEIAKYRIMDVLGCAIAGIRAQGNKELVNLVTDWGGKAEATIIGNRNKVPMQNAAMVNSILARSFDFEALSPLVDGMSIPAHVSGTTVMTALAICEASNMGGKELITALVIGDDVASRILAASGFALSLGWEGTGIANLFGATAIAGRLLCLNQIEMRNAFGIALNQLSGSMQTVWEGTTDFKLPQGLSSRGGIFSAQLAKVGWTGPKEPLLSQFGYFNLFMRGDVNPEILVKDLGKKYYTDQHFKPYPCCAICHPAIDCALNIVKKYNISTGDIKDITLFVPKIWLNSYVSQPFQIGDYPHGNAVFNYRYMVSNALIRKCIKSEHFSENAIQDSEIYSLANKIVIRELTRPETELLSAELVIEMKDKQKFYEYTNSTKGNPLSNPLSKEEIINKFQSNIEFSGAIKSKNITTIISSCNNLENLDSVKKLIELL